MRRQTRETASRIATSPPRAKMWQHIVSGRVARPRLRWGIEETMSKHQVTPDGLVRKDGRVAEQVPALELGLPLPNLLEDLSSQDREAARQFVKIGQTQAATYLTSAASQ